MTKPSFAALNTVPTIDDSAALDAPPLKGIKVIELARILAGPWIGQSLADLGAEVIKIESPQGDDTRAWGPPFYEYNHDDDQTEHTKDAAYYYACNHTKSNRILDLKQPQDLDVLMDLIGDADIFIENYKKDGLVKFGLDYLTLSAKFPKLIYCSITGFGQTGPYSHLPGYDLLIQGLSGMMSITGQSDQEPQKIGVALADIITGLYGTIAIQAALIERQRSGLGQQIDMSLLDSMIGVLANQGQNYLATGTPPSRRGNTHPNIVPYQVFNDAIGESFLLAVGNDLQFQSLCRVLKRMDLSEDHRFRTNQRRVEHREVLIVELQNCFSNFQRSELLQQLSDHNIPAGPVLKIDEALNDPQVQYRQLVEEVEAPHLKVKTIRLIRNPIRFSRSKLAKMTVAPEFKFPF